MRLLLDTHALLWFASGSPQLSNRAKQHIEDPGHELLLSRASRWEMAIKISLGRLEIGQPLPESIEQQTSLASIKMLDIDRLHVYATTDLPFHHRDPFERLIAAQCLVEDLDLVSMDPAFDAYGVQRVW